ncbi:amidohydrolase [bacterium]|nr:amidohydrolase [bacterium]
MNELVQQAIELRHELHRHPEPSHGESGTAERILTWLRATQPDDLLIGLGGHGIAAVYRGQEDGPRVLIRSDMDALPIHENTSLDYKSTRAGVSHKCGHDGHMAMLSALASRLAGQRPARGEAVLLYQPAEETGEGAAKVIDDPQFSRIDPDQAYALHNLPGFERGAIILREGGFASASVGLRIDLHGATSHAAEPEHGTSPALAVAALINALSAAPQYHTSLGEAAKVTIIHTKLGEVAFGTSPGEAVVMATLRAHRTETLQALQDQCATLAANIAAAYGLQQEVEWVEPFPATVNHADTTAVVRNSASALGLTLVEPKLPFPWSEDFGHFGERCPATLFGLGSGVEHPALHHPDYDFPDDILVHGVNMFDQIIRKVLG